MAVKKDTKVTPVIVPITNVNQYIRVPGFPPYPLAKALQEWDDVKLIQRQTADPETRQEYRWVREVVFTNAAGESYKLPISEQLYEVALYTRASVRFANWMKAHQGETINA